MNSLNHIGLIPDGTRRVSRNHNLFLVDAYWIAMQRIVDAINVFFDNDVKIRAIYLLSTENLSRSEYELRGRPTIQFLDFAKIERICLNYRKILKMTLS